MRDFLLAVLPQRSMHARTAIRPATGGKDGSNLQKQHPVLFPVAALPPLAPRVVPRPRDPVAPTQLRHSERRALLIDEREDVGLRAEQNRMAFFNKACSSCSSACARFNA